jgi:hypothetical protein
MSVNKPFIIACIPAYNEEKTIAKVIIQTQKYADKRSIMAQAIEATSFIAYLITQSIQYGF